MGTIVSLDYTIGRFEVEAEAEGGKIAGKHWDKLPHYSMLEYAQGKQKVLGKLQRALNDAGSLRALVGGDGCFIRGSHPLCGDILALIIRDPNVVVIQAAR